jgi:3',5'-cyclic AMP phosphodiesterase CpdA
MRRLVHISDLHFGRTDELLVTAITQKIRELRPDVLVVSGDLTQRARSWQFEQAHQFLDTFDCARIVVPGNHDVPMFNLFERFSSPLAKYRRYISPDLSPTYQDEEVSIVGINTARSFTRSGGSISDIQIDAACRFFSKVHRDSVKIIVTHHPFDFAETLKDKYLLRRARHAIAALGEYQADLYLAGHSHVPFAGLTERRYTVAHHTALIVQAGTSVSTRTRSEGNSFNIIHVRRPFITVEHVRWNGQTRLFQSSSFAHFKHNNQGWQSTGHDMHTSRPA